LAIRPPPGGLRSGGAGPNSTLSARPLSTAVYDRSGRSVHDLVAPAGPHLALVQARVAQHNTSHHQTAIPILRNARLGLPACYLPLPLSLIQRRSSRLRPLHPLLGKEGSAEGSTFEVTRPRAEEQQDRTKHLSCPHGPPGRRAAQGPAA